MLFSRRTLTDVNHLIILDIMRKAYEMSLSWKNEAQLFHVNYIENVTVDDFIVLIKQ